MKKPLLPIHILLIILSTLTLWSLVTWNSTRGEAWFTSLSNLLLLAGAGFVTRFAIQSLIDETYKPRLEHRLITLFILFLLFDIVLTPWWLFVLLGIVTELTQYFFRTPLGPIFNPAALGTLLVSIFGYLPSWWGVNPPPRIPLVGIEVSLAAWLTAFGAGYVIYRYRKLAIAWSTLIASGLAYLVLFGANPSYLLLEGTLLFFVFVMVCEPKTSPIPKKDQILYGSIVGALMPVGLYFHFLEASVIALLLGNLYTSRNVLLKLLSQKEKGAPQTPANL